MNTKYFFNPPSSFYDRIDNSGLSYNVFVYGTLKAGQSNHSLLSPEHTGSDFMGAAVTCGETYVMACNGGFPMIQDTRIMGPDTYKIIGEIYTIDRKTLSRLDMLESNGRMYSRVQRPFMVNIEGEPTEVIAWVYLYLGSLQHYSDKYMTTLTRYVDSKKSKLIEWNR